MNNNIYRFVLQIVYLLSTSIISPALFTLMGVVVYRYSERKSRRYSHGNLLPVISMVFLAVFGITTATLISSASVHAESLYGDKAEVKNSPNIVIILIDALRYERLHSNGNPEEVSPYLDAFSRESVNFKHAYSQAPWTRPSVASLFTGLYPHQHRTINAENGIPLELKTYIELFQESGYDTAGFSTNPQVSQSTYMDQGFDNFNYFNISDIITSPEYGYLVQDVGEEYPGSLLDGESEESKYLVPASVVFKAVEKWMGNRDTNPFFAYLHLCDTHIPYQPPDSYIDRILDKDVRPRDFRSISKNVFEQLIKSTFYLKPDSKLAANSPVLRNLISLYDASILYTDDETGKFFDVLKEKGLYDNTIIVVLSDHGEDFGDHGHFFHGDTLYNTLLHVPLMIRFPNGELAAQVDEPVSLFDLMPTIADYVGIDGLTDRPAISRLPLISGNEKTAVPPIVSHTISTHSPSGKMETRFSILFSGLKLIKTNVDGKAAPVLEIYSMENDFQETDNLVYERKDETKELMVMMKQIEAMKYNMKPVEAEFDKDTADRLKQMGYIH